MRVALPQGLTVPGSLANRSRAATCKAVAASSSRAQRRQSAAAAAVCRRRHRCLRASAGAAQAEAAAEVEELKAALLDSFWGTDRGLSASSDARAEINELITQLEARNPTPEPNEAQAALGGTWRLAYTSNSELLAVLALQRLPLVTVGDITQTVDPLGQTVENRVELQAPLSKTALSATASFEVRSPKLLQVSFQEGRVATPQLLADLQLPASLDVLGQTLDLAPLQAALQPLEGPLRSALGALGGLLGSVPDLRVPLPSSASSSASTWLLNTYLDDTLRITRGDGGSVFVLVREAAADTGYDYAAAMHSSDWERIEEQEPPASYAGEVAAAAVMAEASVEGGGAAVEVVEVEVIDVERGSGGLGNGTGADA